MKNLLDNTNSSFFAMDALRDSLLRELDHVGNKIENSLNSWKEFSASVVNNNGDVKKNVNINMSQNAASLRELLEYFVQQDVAHEEFDQRSEFFANHFRTDLDFAKGLLKAMEENSRIKYKPNQMIHAGATDTIDVRSPKEDAMRMNEVDVTKVTKDEAKLAEQLAGAQDEISMLKKELASIKKAVLDKNLEEVKGETVKFPEAKKRLRSKGKEA